MAASVIPSFGIAREIHVGLLRFAGHDIPVVGKMQQAFARLKNGESTPPPLRVSAFAIP
jgi:hypothetical protein